MKTMLKVAQPEKMAGAKMLCLCTTDDKRPNCDVDDKTRPVFNVNVEGLFA